MYQIIRCGDEYCLVIVATPADAKPGDTDTKFYGYRDWIEGYEKCRFVEMSRMSAECYFSGHSDGLGWMMTPDRTFETLQDIEQFVEKERKRIFTERTTVRENDESA